MGGLKALGNLVKWSDMGVFGSLEALSASVPPCSDLRLHCFGHSPWALVWPCYTPSPGSPSCSAALHVSGFLGSHPLSGGRFHR